MSESKSNVLTIKWRGSKKNAKGPVKKSQVIFTVAGQSSEPAPYAEDQEVEFAITGGRVPVKVMNITSGGKQAKMIEGEFDLESGKDYECVIVGKYGDFKGFGICMSKPGESVGANDPTLYNNVGIAILSFAFPIYGFIKAMTSKYNKSAALWGAFAGFVLATLVSIMASDNGTIGLGMGSRPVIEYEVFSFMDILINLLVGGIASLRGLLYMLLEGMLG